MRSCRIKMKQAKEGVIYGFQRGAGAHSAQRCENSGAGIAKRPAGGPHAFVTRRACGALPRAPYNLHEATRAPGISLAAVAQTRPRVMETTSTWQL